MNALLVMVRREFWEHRALWIAPLAVAALLLVGAVFGGMHLDRGIHAPGLTFGPVPATFVARSAFAFMMMLAMVSGLAVIAYLLDSLYAERKDRSILFWKSLPVSDARTVLVKFAVGMLVVPLGVFLVEVVTHLIATGILSLRGSGNGFGPGLAGAWLGAQASVLATTVVAILWYAPVAAYLMLASVYARRAPLVVAALPPLILTTFEQLLFDTRYVSGFLGRRLGARVHFADVWTSPELWLGLVAAAGMLYIVVRLRRYRDDT